MANEAVWIETPTRFNRFQLSAATSLSGGTLMAITTDPNIVAAGSTSGQSFAGILWGDSESADGNTNVTTAVNGVADLKCAGSTVGLGSMVAMSGANLIREANATDLLSGAIVGKALEQGAAAEVIRVRIGGY